MIGAFHLKTPKDLFAKLGRELERLRRDPDDVDVAFNFFVTAESLLDWLHPGNAGRSAREAIRRSAPLLEVVSHLASGAKHFDQLAPHHKSVTNSGSRVGIFGRQLSPDGGAIFRRQTMLAVELSGSAATALGPVVSVLDLAERVYAHWKADARLQ
jgi:hypothetical protein